ncbi:MAG: arsenate reductase ArsC [Chloroflexi bacterium]|nr:arsenate reductase ArsC [Chloroflexota bacterium]
MSPDVLHRRIQESIERLAGEFAGVYGQETVSRCVYESMALLEGSQLVEFVPVLVYRFARERLRAQAEVEGLVNKERPEVLFVCVHNAGRSQMAAGLMDLLGGGRVHVRSAGSTPASEINPAVVRAMEEVGVDLSKEFPKPLTDDVVRAADVVITMGCGDACAVFPGKRYLDWELTDPAGRALEEVRLIRDEIRARVEGLLRELGVGGAG